MLALWVVLVVRNPPGNAEAIRDAGSIPGSGRSHGEGNGIPLQYSCLESPVERRAWRTTIHRVTQSWTWLKQLSTQHSETLAHYISITIGDNFIPFSALKTQTPLFPFFLLADDLASCFTSKLKASRNEHWQVLHHVLSSKPIQVTFLGDAVQHFSCIN